jgi:hypothetical protein
LTGSASLQFLRVSQSGIHLRLANQSSEVVSFRGTYDTWSRAKPWDILMECNSPGLALPPDRPFALVDGGPQVVDVSPGKQVELVVGDQPTGENKGERCRLSVRLVGGSFIKSNEFEP